jgi:leader peptidase (prepilin peptidase)/N-methyltransferase
MTAVLVVACSIVGLVVGWLLDPVITRVPLKQPVFGPLPADEAPSSPTSSAPPASSSVRRVLVTILTGALFGATAARFDDSWLLPAYLVFTGALVALAVIDFETYLLPNRIVYPLTVAMLALLALGTAIDGDLGDYGRGLVAGAIAFVIFFVLHLVSPRSMGFGDVKLSFTLGLALGVLGWGDMVLGLFLGFLYGAVIGLILIATKVRGKSQAVPFGPFLAAGAITAVLIAAPILDWYRGA